jgi:hypothetical protein
MTARKKRTRFIRLIHEDNELILPSIQNNHRSLQSGLKLKTYDQLDHWIHYNSQAPPVPPLIDTNTQSESPLRTVAHQLYAAKNKLLLTSSPDRNRFAVANKKQNNPIGINSIDILKNELSNAERQYSTYEKILKDIVDQCSEVISMQKTTQMPVNSVKEEKKVARKKKQVHIVTKKSTSRALTMHIDRPIKDLSLLKLNRGEIKEKKRELDILKQREKVVKYSMLPLKFYIKKIKYDLYKEINQMLSSHKFPDTTSITWAIKERWAIGFKFDESLISNIVDSESISYLISISTLELEQKNLNNEKQKLEQIASFLVPIRKRQKNKATRNIKKIMHSFCQTTNRSHNENSGSDIEVDGNDKPLKDPFLVNRLFRRDRHTYRKLMT